MRIWGDQDVPNDTRPDRIVELLKTLDLAEDFSIVDLACGKGDVIKAIKIAFPEANALGVDIDTFPEWDTSFKREDMMDFIKQPSRWDVVLMLNSYRNWEGSDEVAFDKWKKDHTKYFIWDDIEQRFTIETL